MLQVGFWHAFCRPDIGSVVIGAIGVTRSILQLIGRIVPSSMVAVVLLHCRSMSQVCRSTVENIRNLIGSAIICRSSSKSESFFYELVQAVNSMIQLR